MAPATDFSALSDDYSHLLQLAKERHGLDVVPLLALRGGQTGASLFLVSVSGGGLRRVEHYILKFDRANARSKKSEIERHRLALREAPEQFAAQNMAQLAFEVQHEGFAALFYTIAGQSLQRFRTLASNDRQSRLEVLFAATSDHLLDRWNAGSSFEQAVHARDLLKRWLGYRLGPDGRIGSFLQDACRVAEDTEGFLVQGQLFPNPFAYGTDASRWGGTRPIDALIGFQHGDLNIGNVLAKFAEDSDRLEGYFLIDFALFKSGMPLLYDLCYLEMSYLVRELERTSLEKWVDLVVRFSTRDRPDPKAVPVELAGACTVLNAGRVSFERWIRGAHPSVSDDLWGQFWLAAVAAGLNFCNKTALAKEARLAGLIYSAVHLKRYGDQFGVPQPVEGRSLYDSATWQKKVSAATPRGEDDSRGTGLPIPPTPFIGRGPELKQVRDLLASEGVRLVTLTGPGGTGKTRLALEAAGDPIGRFDDGVYLIELASVRDPEGVLSAIGRVLGLRETSDGSLLNELKNGLGSKSVLLILDNFEQVTAAAPKIARLLADCPGLKLLATSREALHVRGEHVFPVPPLALPESDLKASNIDQLARYEAVQLFVERARAVKPSFELTEENVRAVSEICLRLDGLPLAIELATARIRLFSPQALLERLGSRLKLLRGGARDLPARQQTLHDTIDWSYQLLDAGEKRLFALLSCFTGCTLQAVETVAANLERVQETGTDVLEAIASLVDKSLIRQAGEESGEPRFMMLETIREYARGRLEEDGGFSEDACRAHAGYFADFTQRQWTRLTGGGREGALAEMESNLENMRSAWTFWAAEGDLEQLRKLSDGLWLLYDARGWFHAMADLVEDLLEVLASTPTTPERAEQEIMLQTSLARTIMAIKGCTQEVEDAYTRALALCHDYGAVPQLFPVLRGLASFYTYVGDLEKGVTLGRQILNLAEEQDDTGMRVDGHLLLGYSTAFRYDLVEGLELLDRGIAHYDPDRRGSGRFRLGNDSGVACYTTSALLLWMLGYPDRALSRADAAVALADKLHHPFSSAYAFFHSGLLHLWRREPERVLERARAAFETAQDHEFQIWRALSLCLEGAAIAESGRPEEGLRQVRRGIDLYKDMHTPPVFWPMLLMIRARVYGKAGRPADGVALVDEALEIVGGSGGFMLSPEFCRLKAELLLLLSPDNSVEAEALFREAVAAAIDRKAATLELRAAVGLCRLLREQARSEEGRRVLTAAFEKMTEGFATPDLQDAKALLTELEESSTI